MEYPYFAQNIKDKKLRSFLEKDFRPEQHAGIEVGAARALAARRSRYFDLKLDSFGPYSFNYSRNGRSLLLGGQKGHLAHMDWKSKQLGCEFHVYQTVRDVHCPKQYLYIYDTTGTELHCMKQYNRVKQAHFPALYHFLLVSAVLSHYGAQGEEPFGQNAAHRGPVHVYYWHGEAVVKVVGCEIWQDGLEYQTVDTLHVPPCLWYDISGPTVLPFRGLSLVLVMPKASPVSSYQVRLRPICALEVNPVLRTRGSARKESAGREKWKARGKSGVTKQVHKKQEGKEQSKKALRRKQVQGMKVSKGDVEETVEEVQEEVAMTVDSILDRFR
eukprot:Em0162g16a